MGVCTSDKCPRNWDLSHIAQDTANSWFWPTWVGKMAPNGPWYAPCWVSHGPKRSSEGGINLVGRVHKGFGTALGRCGPTLARFGPFSVPRATGAILSSKVTTNRCQQGFRSPNGCLIDGLTWGYAHTKFWGFPDCCTRDTENGPPSGPPNCLLAPCCLLDPPKKCETIC